MENSNKILILTSELIKKAVESADKKYEWFEKIIKLTKYKK